MLVKSSVMSSMAMRLVLLLLAIVMAGATLDVAIPDQSPAAVERWFTRLPQARQKLTKLHFFIHDVMTGDNPTTIPIAQANSTANSPTRFGLVFVMDSPLTEGPELDSKVIGRCQGTFAFTSQREIGLLLTLNFVFTDGYLSGSTLSVLGPKFRDNRYREYPIIGGSGLFRLATGTAVDGTYMGPISGGTRPTECQVMVLHYDEDWHVEKM